MSQEQTWAVHKLVSLELAEDRPVLEALMRDLVTIGAERAGYDVHPETFELHLVKRNKINGDPMLTEAERAAGLTGDEPLARASIRCVARPS